MIPEDEHMLTEARIQNKVQQFGIIFISNEMEKTNCLIMKQKSY